jgi:hypothetical protein
MYKLRTKGGKRDPLKRWALPERVFFACGACHILAYAFLQAYPDSGFAPVWIRPKPGYTGNHIVAIHDESVFDYHGYSNRQAFFAHVRRRAEQRWPGWDATLVPLPVDVLISEPKSRQYAGLWLMEPQQFLHDSLPRAYAYLKRFPAPNDAKVF